jgi:class 3 adenylate cyclase
MKKLKSILIPLAGNISVVILITTAILLISMFKDLGETIQDMTGNMIKERLFLTENKLNSFFQPVINELEKTRERAQNGMFENLTDLESVNVYFQPIISNSSNISSVMIANELGDEYMIHKKDSVLVNRITYSGSSGSKPKVFTWSRSDDGKQTLIARGVLDENYDPRNTVWYKSGFSDENEENIIWSQPYSFFNSGAPGITAITRWQDPRGIEHVLAMDILLSELSDFTTAIDLTPNGKVFILSDKMQVLGLPNDVRFHNRESRGKYHLADVSELGIPIVKMAVEKFTIFEDSIQFYPFDYENRKYWAGSKLYNLDKLHKIIIGIVIPLSDFSEKSVSTRRKIIVGLIFTFLFLISLIFIFQMMKRANKLIRLERDKNERLLLNALPEKVVKDLKAFGKSEPEKFDQVSVCFSDIVGFTEISTKLDPKLLISELNLIYSAFDDIITKYDCERIKTIGDAYMCVCGMPEKKAEHAEAMILASVEMLSFLERRNQNNELKWQIRVGIHSGEVVGGIVGVKKYIYDIFGDTINTASRLESLSAPMRINISEATYKLVNNSEQLRGHSCTFEKRTPIEVKGKGMMNMYFVNCTTRTIQLES